MSDIEQRYWIVYNGEIYNHTELRVELEALGYTFVSRSDTEVIITAYRQWGVDCLHRFNGMFAFVLLDRVAKRVFIARDRFGVKPLYLWRGRDGMVAVASEIKQFSALPSWQAHLNAQRAYEFLTWGLFDHTNETLFEGARQLRGGQMIECTLEEILNVPSVTSWYRLEPATAVNSFGDAVDAVCGLLKDSVRLRLRADVPVGSCLSGGLDSSSIVCIANRILRDVNADALQKSFSARSSDERIDEGIHIEAVVQSTGITNLQVRPDWANLVRLLPTIVWHQDEPFNSTSIFAQWEVFRLAREDGVKVMLDGQGADELFMGYHTFFPVYLAGLVRQMRLHRFVSEMAEIRQVHGLAVAGLIRGVVGHLIPQWLRWPLRGRFGRSGPAVPDWMDMERLRVSATDPYFSAGSRGSSVQDLSRAQILATSLPMLLHWEDRDSMAHGVEARVPFLDFRLVEFVLGLPDSFKIRGGTTKLALREAMNGILPESIRTRTDKIGFATAEEQWIRWEAPETFRAAMREAVDASAGVLTPRALDLLGEMIDGRREFSFLPWRIVSFGAWMKRFDVQVAT